MRRGYFYKADFAIVCIPKDSDCALENVRDWVGEANNKPIFLLQTKSDLAEEQVTLEDLRKVQSSAYRVVDVASTSA